MKRGAERVPGVNENVALKNGSLHFTLFLFWFFFLQANFVLANKSA
jgi:hypothetical protein